MRCHLCGYEFEPATLGCHASCPLGKHCNLLCCPNCGYQVVDESKSRLVSWVQRWWPTHNADAGDQPPPRYIGNRRLLSHVAPGEEVEVESMDEMTAARLSLFGLAPGGRVRIVQRQPVPVIAIGETQLALSHEILDQIWVHPRDEIAERPLR